MADIRKIRIMISSRSRTKVFGDKPLQEVREQLRTFLHSIRWQGTLPGTQQIEGTVGRDQALFDVWIHEDDVGRPADSSTLEMSLKEINRADIILVLYTGEAGSAHGDGEIGICHAELKQALERRSELVTIIDLLPLSAGRAVRDKNFREYVARLEVPRMQVNDETELQQKVAEALQERVSELVKRGATVGIRKKDRGPALDWKSLDQAHRQGKMRQALIVALAAQDIQPEAENVRPLHQIELSPKQQLAVRIDAIPDALSVASARERVGQPFLHDHLFAGALQKNGLPGVVHIIACQKGVTETQATKMLGTPDAISVPSDFGVYAADHVQKIQIVFLAQCSDETAVALAVRRFREWLRQSGEEEKLMAQAASRLSLIHI